MIKGIYIQAIELKNIRGFNHLSINLETGDGQRMMSVIIGRNGTCKSTLLRCLALALCHETDAAALLADFDGRLVSEGSTIGSITLIIKNASETQTGTISLQIESKEGRDILKERKSSMPGHDFFVCGYGPNRANTGSSMVRKYRVLDSVATLFDYRRSLVDIELMMRRLEDHMGTNRYDRAQKGIKRVMGLDDNHSIEVAKGGGVKISGPGTGNDIPLEAWADGYRMTFHWLIDLYGWAMHADVLTEDGGIRGILLIDEIDQNLHPELQSKLLSELGKALPEMQIFATSHSPMTALGTDAGNVVSLQRKDDLVNVVPVPSLAGYSADDALVEDALFGTSPYPPQTRRKLQRYRELAAIPKTNRTKEQNAELKTLSSELSPADLPPFKDDPMIKKLDQIAELLKKEKAS